MSFVRFLALILILTSCSNDVFYSEKITLPDQNWSYEDTLKFEFTVTDTTNRYDLVLNVMHDIEYAYENCYVRIWTNFPDGNSVQDLVSLELTDQMDQWQGKCKGKKCKVPIILQEKIYFRKEGKHIIKIEQYNRRKLLEGIQSFEFKIIEAQG